MKSTLFDGIELPNIQKFPVEKTFGKQFRGRTLKEDEERNTVYGCEDVGSDWDYDAEPAKLMPPFPAPKPIIKKRGGRKQKAEDLSPQELQKRVKRRFEREERKMTRPC